MLPEPNIVAGSLKLSNNSALNIVTTLKELYAELTSNSENNCIENKENVIKNLSNFFVNATEQITTKLLESNEEYVKNYSNHDSIHTSVMHLTEIMTTSIAALSSILFQNSDSFSQLFGPSLVKLYLTFRNDLVWTCNEEKKNVETILKTMLPILEKSTLQEYLLSTKKSTYKKMILQFTSSLTSNTWKQHLPIAFAYRTLIVELSSRHQLSESLSEILSPILLFIDDFQSNNVVLGLVILKKLLDEVPSAEFRMYGWADVIHDALKTKLYHRDSAMLDHCIPCMLLILNVLERDPKKSDKSRTRTKYDKSLQIIISNLTMCTSNHIIRVHWKHLPSFLEVMDITILRHLKDLLELFEYHLDIGNAENLNYIFQTIEVIIRIAWISKHREGQVDSVSELIDFVFHKNFNKKASPKFCVDAMLFNPHAGKMLKMLLKLALRLNMNKSHNERHYKKIQRCIILLYNCNETLVKDTLDQLKQLPEWNETDLQVTINIEAAV